MQSAETDFTNSREQRPTGLDGTTLLLFDAAGVEGRSLLFDRPQEIISCSDMQALPECLQRLDALRADGYHLFGYISYEALDQLHALQTGRTNFDNHKENQPLLWQAATSVSSTIGPEYLDKYLEGLESSLDASDYQLILNVTDAQGSERQKFARAFRKVQRHLFAGDCYQVNYTQNQYYEFSGNPVSLYRRLRKLQPTARSALVIHEGRAILSLSPELFFQLHELEGTGQWLIEVEPMKGTTARSPDAHEDQKNKQSLKDDEKIQAENLMIVDLLRNDLGKLALPGSVRVKELFKTISLPSVHQLVSRIEARLPGNTKLFQEIFSALFPSGSVTGAPRRRVRQIIQELETEPRGIYTGAIGYALAPGQERDPIFSVSKGAGLPLVCYNVAIRTLDIDLYKDQAIYGAGCGLVRDSRLRDEWHEYRLKQAFLTPARDDFHLIETMLLQDGRFYFLEEHIQRLDQSALTCFGMNSSSREKQFAQIQYNLAELAREYQSENLRVRLALYRNRFEITHSRLSDFQFGRTGGKGSMIKIGMAREKIFSGNPLRQHKSSERQIYERGFRLALQHGLADLIFLNEQDLVVEGSISNLLILDAAGEWRTPNAQSGALRGVMLQVLEKACQRIKSDHISRQDIKSAKAIFLLNSVRGLRRACIDWEFLPGQVDLH